MPDGEYLTIPEVCARLHMNRGQLQRLLRRFRLENLLRPGQGREVRLRWTDIASFVEDAPADFRRSA
jgi:hypothetical protein